MKKLTTMMLGAVFLATGPAMAQSDLRASVAADYDENLEALFTHFHQNPELSHREFKTAERLAAEPALSR